MKFTVYYRILELCDHKCGVYHVYTYVLLPSLQISQPFVVAVSGGKRECAQLLADAYGGLVRDWGCGTCTSLLLGVITVGLEMLMDVKFSLFSRFTPDT